MEKKERTNRKGEGDGEGEEIGINRFCKERRRKR